MRLISCVKSLSFEYAEKEIEGEDVVLTWQTEWIDKEADPVAIKINLNIGEKSSQSLSRVIYLPKGEEL